MSKKQFNILPNPCSTCPYRKDTAPGIWDREEYEKLPAYDEQWGGGGVFLCHNGGPKEDNNTLCRGWTEVHHRNITVRLACSKTDFNEHNSKLTKVPLYSSGREAMRAGLRGINRPSAKAKSEIEKLVKRLTTK